MGYIKRQYEVIVDKVTIAIYEECFDMPDYLDSTRAEVYDSAIEWGLLGKALFSL